MSDATSRPRFGPNDILRFFLELVAIAAVAMWGIFSWPFPWNIGVGIAAPALVILIWALFNSPRAVFHLDLFGRSLVEIIVMFAAALALFSLGGPMQIVAAVFAVVAAVSGLIHGRRQLAD